jgi:hypothetical protein
VAVAISLVAVLARATGLPFAAGLVLLLSSTLALRNNLVFGQIYMALTLLVAVALVLRDAGRRCLAGTLLGVVTALKMFSLPLLLYFLWRREWRTVIGFFVGMVLVFGTSLWLLGWETHVYWATAVLPRTLKGFGDSPAINLHTWNSLLLKLFYYDANWNPDPLFPSTFAFWLVRDLGILTLLGCVFFAVRTRDNALALSVLVLVLPIISPSTRTYQLVLCVVPLAYWGMHLIRQGKWPVAAAAVCLYVFAASPLPYRYPDLFLRLAALLGLAILLLRELRPWQLPAWVLPAIAVVGLLHAAVASQPRKQDAAVAVTPEASLVVSPTVRGRALAYSALSCEGCNGYTLRGDVPTDLRFTGHIFGTRFPRNSSSLFFEVAEHRHSTVYEWRDGRLYRWTPPQMNCVTPAPSRDGRQIVVVSNGALHLFSATDRGRVILSLEGEVADPDLAPDGESVAFAWRRNGQWRIYETDLTGRDPVRLTGGRKQERWPRYSPHGAWLAFSRQDPTGDIWVIERESGREQRITQDPDNDTEPAWSDDGKALYFVSDRYRAVHQGSAYRIALPADVTESTP